MYQLLIVDDEYIVRQSIVKVVDWASLGFTKVYEAGDGIEALEICRNNKIDVVLSDIVMPFMDGLELTKALKVEFPDIYVVILTGHEDFEYAKQSVNLGVKYFILKPVGAATLYENMKEICEELNIKTKENEYINKMRRQIHRSLPILQEKFLNKLITRDNGRHQEIREKIETLDIPLSSGQYIVGIIEIDLSKTAIEDKELFIFTGKNIAAECLGSNHCVFDNRYNQIVIIMNLRAQDSNEIHKTIAYSTLQVILKAIKSILKIDISGAIGSVVNDLKEIYISFDEANLALECRYSLGKNKIYDIDDLDYIEQSYYYPYDEIHDLINNVKFFDENEIDESIDIIFTKLFESKNISFINIKMIFIEIITSLLKLLSNVKDLTSNVWENGIELYNNVEQLDSIGRITNKLRSFAKQVSKEYKKIQTKSTNNIIEITKEYIHKNYSDEELTLTSAADHACVSTGYLSGLFKKETDKNFVEYLTSIRMEEAMKLFVTTDMKNYEIAFEVGYSNPHYFSISFKKFSGMSPSEFKKQNTNASQGIR